jgi:tellurite resistance protein TerC
VLVFWIVFNVFVLAMLALDLGVLNRRSHRIGFREALAWSGIWIALAAAFAVLELLWHGRAEALQFVTSYVIELSLSVDNLFVFLLIFRYFKVQGEYEHKILFWGILGALVVRGLFIAAGVGLIRHFHWINYGFGALLVYSGIKLLLQGGAQVHPEKNLFVRGLRRLIPVTDDYVGGRFFTRQGGGRTGAFAPRGLGTRVLAPQGWAATPLFAVLLVIETSDIFFAVDSIPAVLAVTTNAFIVYTSNVFAILGLRSLYFALSGMLGRFFYLHYGLSVVLILIGLKMLASHYISISTEWTLAAVLFTLAASVVASVLNPQSKTI